ncbi:MAG: sugar-transfer associated ATP-grasp domain-containing protein [Thermoleophilia bacterium]
MKLMRVVQRGRQYVDRTRSIRTAARDQYGVAWLPMQLRAMRLRRKHGWGLDESLAVGLLDPESTLDPDVTASPRETTDLQYFMNAHRIEAVSEDKVVFHMLARAAGLPTPAVHATLMAGAMGWDFLHGHPIHPGMWAEAFDAMPDELVVKPSEGFHGHGVRVVTRDGDRWRDVQTGRRTPASELVAELQEHPDYRDWIVQERLRNHPDLARFQSEALHTVRLVTFIRDDGTVEFLWAGLRLAAPGNAVDNFRSGRLGNMTCELALEDGAITAVHKPRVDRPGLVQVHDHPHTGEALDGLRLPDWGAMRELAQRVAPAFLPIRTLGIDFGLTPEGPKVVEVNMWWDVPPVAPVRPILDRLWAQGRALAK